MNECFPQALEFRDLIYYKREFFAISITCRHIFNQKSHKLNSYPCRVGTIDAIIILSIQDPTLES